MVYFSDRKCNMRTEQIDDFLNNLIAANFVKPKSSITVNTESKEDSKILKGNKNSNNIF